jgi:hypothetical protein
LIQWPKLLAKSFLMIPRGGAEWYIVANYPSGQQEHITGFRSEADAKHWITNGAKAWLEKAGPRVLAGVRAGRNHAV